MSQEPIYEEDDAIRVIRETLSKEINDKFADDDIMEVVDSIWDYYEDNGLLSLDDINDEDDEIDINAMAKEIFKTLHKNGPKGITIEDISLIIKGEQAYEEGLASI